MLRKRFFLAFATFFAVITIGLAQPTVNFQLLQLNSCTNQLVASLDSDGQQIGSATLVVDGNLKTSILGGPLTFGDDGIELLEGNHNFSWVIRGPNGIVIASGNTNIYFPGSGTNYDLICPPVRCLLLYNPTPTTVGIGIKRPSAYISCGQLSELKAEVWPLGYVDVGNPLWVGNFLLPNGPSIIYTGSLPAGNYTVRMVATFVVYSNLPSTRIQYKSCTCDITIPPNGELSLECFDPVISLENCTGKITTTPPIVIGHGGAYADDFNLTIEGPSIPNGSQTFEHQSWIKYPGQFDPYLEPGVYTVTVEVISNTGARYYCTSSITVENTKLEVDCSSAEVELVQSWTDTCSYAALVHMPDFTTCPGYPAIGAGVEFLQNGYVKWEAHTPSGVGYQNTFQHPGPLFGEYKVKFYINEGPDGIKHACHQTIYVPDWQLCCEPDLANLNCDSAFQIKPGCVDTFLFNSPLECETGIDITVVFKTRAGDTIFVSSDFPVTYTADLPVRAYEVVYTVVSGTDTLECKVEFTLPQDPAPNTYMDCPVPWQGYSTGCNTGKLEIWAPEYFVDGCAVVNSTVAVIYVHDSIPEVLGTNWVSGKILYSQNYLPAGIHRVRFSLFLSDSKEVFCDVFVNILGSDICCDEMIAPVLPCQQFPVDTVDLTFPCNEPFTLQWLPATDNCGVSFYTVSIFKDGSNICFYCMTMEPEYTIHVQTGLYRFVITAYDYAGNPSNSCVYLFDITCVEQRNYEQVRQAPEQFQVRVAPNPFSDVLRFTTNLPDDDQLTVRVLNLASQVVTEQTTVAGENVIDMNDQPVGIYILHIIGQKYNSSHRVMKK